MQRIEALIEKLKAQFQDHSDLPQLLITTQMIQREINGAMKEMSVLGSSSVAVFVPNTPSIGAGRVVRDKNGVEKEYFELASGAESDTDEDELMLLQLQHEAGLFSKSNLELMVEPGPSSEPNTCVAEFNPLVDVPTLFQQVRHGGSQKVSDRVVDAIGDNATDINDLNKDISEKDKDRFVRNLFRGDEIMYNRSIKTINNFDTLEEAEYWVMRELKTKLGWVNNKDVEYFERLLHRKFS